MEKLDKRDDTMHIVESITDELREWMDRTTTRFDGRRYLLGTDEELTAIADRIDATNETAMSRAGQLLADVEKDRDYNYANWQECKQKVLQGNITIDELNARIERLEDELSHRIELPKDADGEYIRIGDAMEWPTTHETFEVVGIGDGTLFYIEDGSEQADWTGASTKRHHRAPTVEDVLTEFGIDWEYEDNCEDRAALLAEYAAKLRLADGEDA